MNTVKTFSRLLAFIVVGFYYTDVNADTGNQKTMELLGAERFRVIKEVTMLMKPIVVQQQNADLLQQNARLLQVNAHLLQQNAHLLPQDDRLLQENGKLRQRIVQLEQDKAEVVEEKEQVIRENVELARENVELRDELRERPHIPAYITGRRGVFRRLIGGRRHCQTGRCSIGEMLGIADEKPVVENKGELLEHVDEKPVVENKAELLEHVDEKPAVENKALERIKTLPLEEDFLQKNLFSHPGLLALDFLPDMAVHGMQDMMKPLGHLSNALGRLSNEIVSSDREGY